MHDLPFAATQVPFPVAVCELWPDREEAAVLNIETNSLHSDHGRVPWHELHQREMMLRTLVALESAVWKYVAEIQALEQRRASMLQV